MKLNRFGAALSLMASGALVLSGAVVTTIRHPVGGSSLTLARPGGQGRLRWQEVVEGQRLDRAGQCDDPVRQRLRAACPGYTLNYTSNGSGAGVSEFIGNQTDFGGSDSPLNKDKGEYDKADAALRFARVEPAGGVRPHCDHLQRRGRRRPRARWADGGQDLQRWRSPRWNDPAIAALNSGATLPARPDHTSCSAATSPAPRTTSRSTSMPRRTARGARAPARPSTAVSARAPRATRARRRRSRTPPGSITYNEWSFAQAQNLSMARDRHFGRARTGRNQHRHGRQDHRRRQGQG